MGLSQRQKGASAEREVAAKLQSWWEQLEPGCRFVRTPASGGWGAGAAVRKDFATSGDLMTTAKLFPFCVEVKRREGWSDEVLFGTKLVNARGERLQSESPVWAWWRQAQAAAREQGAVPLLAFRRSHQPWRVIVPLAWWREHEFADWRASVEWAMRWPSSRGLRPVCHYLDQFTGIHPKWMARERVTSLRTRPA